MCGPVRSWCDTKKLLVNKGLIVGRQHIISTHFGQFWIVRHTMIRHVECGDVARVSQCTTLHSAIHDGGRYILPLAFDLAGTEYGWDLNSIIHRWMSTRKRENVTTLKADPSIVEYMILPLLWKGTGK